MPNQARACLLLTLYADCENGEAPVGGRCNSCPPGTWYVGLDGSALGPGLDMTSEGTEIY